MKRIRCMIMAFVILVIGVPSLLASDISTNSIEEARLGVFADVLMAPDASMTMAHIGFPGIANPVLQEARKWINEQRAIDWRVPFVPYIVTTSFPSHIDEVVFRYLSPIIRLDSGPSDPLPSFEIGSEWLVIFAPVGAEEWGKAAEFLGQVKGDRPVNPGNLFNIYRSGYGMICVKQGPPPYFGKERAAMEPVHPVEVVEEVREIHTVMAAGGNTNALLALANDLGVDFSRKLVQEIVRRKQPPTLEEQLRAEISDLWALRWKGERIGGLEVRERLREHERNFRADYEAGKISRETYVARMRLLQLDVENQPNRTLQPYQPAPTKEPVSEVEK